MSSKNRTMSTKCRNISTLTGEVSASGARSLLAGRYYTFAALAVLLLLAGSAPILSCDGRNDVLGQPFMSPDPLTESEETPTVQLTYYSDWNLTPAPVLSGARLAGDHIVLVSTWAPVPSILKCRIEVQASALATTIYQESSLSSVEIDTRALNNNATCMVNMTAWVVGGSSISYQVSNVFLGNFFRPEVKVISPNGGETCTGVCTIGWTASDKNADDEMVFEVLISADEGVSFQLIAADLNVTSYEWNCTGFLLLDTYVVQIRASDSIYTTSDTSDGPFTAGTIPVTSITTTSTTPTVTPLNQAAVFLGVTVIVSAIMAVMVYIAAKKWL